MGDGSPIWHVELRDDGSELHACQYRGVEVQLIFGLPWGGDGIFNLCFRLFTGLIPAYGYARNETLLIPFADCAANTLLQREVFLRTVEELDPLFRAI